MSDDLSTLIAARRAIAEAATGDEWQVVHSGDGVLVKAPPMSGRRVSGNGYTTAIAGCGYKDVAPEDAAHIAACDPASELALLAVAEAAEVMHRVLSHSAGANTVSLAAGKALDALKDVLSR